MRDVLTIPNTGGNTLIIASDNSGAIGMKESDFVQADYKTVAYFSFRVAVMECIAAGGNPISVVLHNFCGDDAWADLKCGIHQGLSELGLFDVEITGSTESNFSMQQSAVGLLVLGKKADGKITDLKYNNSLKFAVIGEPLVGNEVLEQKMQIAPLEIFQAVCGMPEVMIWPVGSKGIFAELNQMFDKKKFNREDIESYVDLCKSSGPATCFIAVYPEKEEQKITGLAKEYFHSLNIVE